MRHKLKNILIQILKLSFSVGLIIWLVKSGKLEFKDLTLLLKWNYLLPCLIFAGLNLFFGSERWRALLNAKNLHISLPATAKLTLVGTFFNFAMPGGVGGDVVKAFYISRRNSHAKLTSLVTVVMDRMIGLYCMIVFSLAVMLVSQDLLNKNPELKSIRSILLLIFAVYSLAWGVVFSERLSNLLRAEKWLPKLPFGHRLTHLYKDFTSYRHHKSVFFKGAALSFSAQFVSVLFFVLAGQALGYTEIPMGLYFFVAPIGFMVTAIPVSPAGVGVGQAAFYFLFNTILGHPSQVGPTTITAFQIANFFYGCIGAICYLSLQKEMKAVPHDTVDQGSSRI